MDAFRLGGERGEKRSFGVFNRPPFSLTHLLVCLPCVKSLQNLGLQLNLGDRFSQEAPEELESQ